MSDPVVRRAAGAVWRATPNALVVAVPPAPVVEVTGSGALVWECLAEPATVAELVGRLTAIVSAPAAQVVADVEDLVEELVTLGVLELVPRPDPA
jgi:hypothetical protein